MITVGQARLTLQTIVALALVAGVIVFTLYLRHLQEQAKLAEQRGDTIDRTVEQTEDNTQARVEAQRVEIVVRTARENYNREVANDPTIRDHRAEPVPDRVRELARARRLARERPVGVEGRDEGTARAAPAAER